MRWLDRLATLLLCLSLFFAAIVAPALLIAKSPAYYHRQFERTGIYATTDQNGERVPTSIRFVGGNPRNTAQFTDAQLDAIAAHIVDFLFGDTEDFALTLDGVVLNGETCDGVAVFGEEAIIHMNDVRILMRTAGVAAQVALCLLPLLFFYLILRRRACGRGFFRWVIGFLSAVLLAVGGFCAFTYHKAKGFSFGDVAWRYIHYVLFPFQPEKVAGSFFNDTLTSILTLDLFLTAVAVVLAVLAVALAALLTFAVYMRRRGEDY